MLYKFKSRSTADLILLPTHGRRLLQIIGKEHNPTGIVTLAQIPAAIAALEAAVREDDRLIAAHAKEKKALADDGDASDDDQKDVVSLHQRAAPFIEMLRASQQGGHDVVWGV